MNSQLPDAEILQLALTQIKEQRDAVQKHLKTCERCAPAKGKKLLAIANMEAAFLALSDHRLGGLNAAYLAPDSIMFATTGYLPEHRAYLARDFAKSAVDAALMLATSAILRHDPAEDFHHLDQLIVATGKFRDTVQAREAVANKTAH